MKQNTSLSTSPKGQHPHGNFHKARIGYPCTLSAPKSVSIVALVLDDERIRAAHSASTATVRDAFERLAKEGK